MLRAARALLAMRQPLDVELGVSEMLGSWWGQRVPGVDVDRLLGEGLVTHAVEAGTPAGLAMLSAVSELGTSQRQRLLAAEGARRLPEQGVTPPMWAESVGTARPVAAYVSGSRFGDIDDIICTFRYDNAPGTESGEAGHALIAVIDHNIGGVLRDAWVTTKVDRLLEHCRREAADTLMATFSELTPERARTLLEASFARTHQVLSSHAGNRPVRISEAGNGEFAAGTLAKHHALALARVRALPREENPTAEPVWRRDDRATLAARFLASETSAELSDSYAASRCVDHIIAYGCDIDAGRPLRVSPRKVEAFLLTWLPRHVVLLPEEQQAMPHVLAAWIRWAGPRYGLPESAVLATLDALWESTAEFTRTYLDPATSFGLRREAIRRLLPDDDLSALARRMFAFPLLASDLVVESASEFDPATRAGRRALLRLDHFGEYDAIGESRGRHSADNGGAVGNAGTDDRRAGSVSEEELAAHERLAERLWNGEPSALWEAAQRLLDRGHGRQRVLRTLITVLDAAEDEDDLVERLGEL
ncbi:hypothetical protein [Halostreptopolyspora alba]|uniref:Uncharacterized protein n=1 Tax=Halostreptopolyspora alba TaxID=2487137 RepID=A0A3N0EJ11_9ACTN|nr:hypothetical protein EFW17_00885 [Nocardiopsaceae bacterium YIM 96095]